MGGGIADVGRWTCEGKWSVIPENAESTIDCIAELKARIAGLTELLNDPPTCRDPDKVCACVLLLDFQPARHAAY